MKNLKIIRTKGGLKLHTRAAVSASERGETFSGGPFEGTGVYHDRIFDSGEAGPAEKIIWSALRCYVRDQGWSQADDTFEEACS
jgi:hypothetical protein